MDAYDHAWVHVVMHARVVGPETGGDREPREQGKAEGSCIAGLQNVCVPH
jgi:hypothetical protein